MTSPDDPETDGALDMAAAELALGVLEGEERAAALRRMLAEPGFAREVETWRAHFAVLFAQWPEEEAPAGLEHRVAQSIAPKRSTGGWRAIAAVMTAVAAALLVIVLVRPAPSPIVVQAPPTTPAPAQAAPLVAALAYGDKVAPVAAVYDPISGEVRLAAAPAAPSKHSAELWAIGVDGVPHALGLLADAAPTRILLAAVDRERLAAGTVLAVSIEPAGGSTTGLPTGPVVATGPLGKI